MKKSSCIVVSQELDDVFEVMDVDELPDSWGTYTDAADAAAFHVALANVVGVKKQPLMVLWGRGQMVLEPMHGFSVRKVEATTPSAAGFPEYPRGAPRSPGQHSFGSTMESLRTTL